MKIEVNNASDEKAKPTKKAKKLSVQIKELKYPKYKEESFQISTIKQIEEGNAPL
jgi:hypothetical protein